MQISELGFGPLVPTVLQIISRMAISLAQL